MNKFFTLLWAGILVRFLEVWYRWGMGGSARPEMKETIDLYHQKAGR